jgi:hypothetical protein
LTARSFRVGHDDLFVTTGAAFGPAREASST